MNVALDIPVKYRTNDQGLVEMQIAARHEYRSDGTLLVVYRPTPEALEKGLGLARGLRTGLLGARACAAEARLARHAAGKMGLICAFLAADKATDNANEQAAECLHLLGGLGSVWAETAIPAYSSY